MDLNRTRIEDGVVLLRPRPYAKCAGNLILLPLLPQRPTPKPLPVEVWTKVLRYVFEEYRAEDGCWGSGSRTVSDLRQDLLLVCRTLKDVALPLYYEHVEFTTPVALERFTNILHAADQKWDSIRRIPYSTPGRWVQVVDLAELRCTLWSEVCQVDALLTRLYPLLPFLAQFILNPTIVLSRRVLGSLCAREGNERLTSLRGVKLLSAAVDYEDPFLEFLRTCRNLQDLEFSGSGIEPLLIDSPITITESQHSPVNPLDLPRLRKLAMISMHCSPVMFALLHSSLPSLSHLTVTPYDDVSIAMSLIPKFIEAHGAKLRSFHLYAPKSWPTMLFPSPTTLLRTCPKLYHLSLEKPLPALTICSIYPRHPLRILSIPRPDADFLHVLESLLPKLPNLKIVRARDVRWLRAGMNSYARESGVQGEMRRWRQRLARRGIQVVDATWSHPVA